MAPAGGHRRCDEFPLFGAAGLLASPNRGLLVFSPVLVIAVAVGWMWRTSPGLLRAFVLAWTIPVCGYLFMLGSIDAWGRFGWGPRLLVPVVPILWVPAAVVGARSLERKGWARVAVVALLGLSALIAAVGTLTAWDDVAVTASDVIAQDTPYPK